MQAETARQTWDLKKSLSQLEKECFSSKLPLSLKFDHQKKNLIASRMMEALTPAPGGVRVNYTSSSDDNIAKIVPRR